MSAKNKRQSKLEERLIHDDAHILSKARGNGQLRR